MRNRAAPRQPFPSFVFLGSSPGRRADHSPARIFAAGNGLLRGHIAASDPVVMTATYSLYQARDRAAGLKEGYELPG
jgi:hypothetical protein